MEVEFAPRMEYGRTQPHLRSIETGVVARGGPAQLTLTSPISLRCENGSASTRVAVEAGQIVDFRASYRPAFGRPFSDDSSDAATLEDTLQAWQSWGDAHRGYEGRFATEVCRSSLVLQGLTYQLSGAVVAAATTSLPERMGGGLNFDYPTRGCVISV